MCIRDRLGRSCFGIELEPKFVDVAVKRYLAAVGSAQDVYVIRDDQRLSYEEVTEAILEEEK